MNYLRTYCNLIRKAERRGYNKKKVKDQGLYVEGHHTFPVSIFGKNKRIVYLTAREHYIAHVLLEKIFIKRYGNTHWKTIKMSVSHISFKGNNSSYFNSYLYENGKKRWSEIMKVNNPSKKGISESTRKKLSESRKDKPRSNEIKEKIRNTLLGKKHSKERILKNKMSTCKYLYEVKNPAGIIFRTKNMKFFCIKNNLCPSAMRRVAHGKYKQHKGWTVKILSTLK